VTTLETRLAALRDAVEAAGDRVDTAGARVVLERASSRLGLSLAHTVVALAGATGSGKSSLLNAVSGTELAQVGVRRPTTSRAHAVIWGAEEPDPLLDWLDVPRRHRLPTAGEAGRLDGLVLLDLPDHDSVERSHRAEVDRLVGVVDLLVWVLDPQKYADAAVHDRYLRPLAAHRDVLLVALNQADRLSAGDRQRCLDDLTRLLAADGLAGVPVLAVSARTGMGLDVLRRELADRVASRRGAVQRLAADVTACAEQLGAHCGPQLPDPLRAADRARLVPALSAAAGVDTVVRAVDRAHRSRAATATGWPPTRWLRRLRPDAMRRLRLADRPPDGVGRTSLPEPTAAERARVSSAVRRLTDDVAAGLPDPWPQRLRTVTLRAEEALPDALERAVATADLGMARRPRWWALVGAAQRLVLAAALAGVLWLGALFAWSYLQLGDLPVPHVGRLPLPTLLLLGGVLAGVLLALLARRLAALGARRRARLARRRIEDNVRHTADAALLAPVADELTAYSRFCSALDRARRR
jgi:GTP-binding protein EngB required for normal cell division